MALANASDAWRSLSCSIACLPAHQMAPEEVYMPRNPETRKLVVFGTSSAFVLFFELYSLGIHLNVFYGAAISACAE